MTIGGERIHLLGVERRKDALRLTRCLRNVNSSVLLLLVSCPISIIRSTRYYSTLHEQTQVVLKPYVSQDSVHCCSQHTNTRPRHQLVWFLRTHVWKPRVGRVKRGLVRAGGHVAPPTVRRWRHRPRHVSLFVGVLLSECRRAHARYLAPALVASFQRAGVLSRRGRARGLPNLFLRCTLRFVLKAHKRGTRPESRSVCERTDCSTQVSLRLES